MAEQKPSGAVSSLFTKEQLDNARRAGYSDQEIGLHISEGSSGIKNALESGYSLDEIADYFAVKPVAQKQEEAPKDEGPSLGQIGAGLVADVAISEGGKAASTLLGAKIGALPALTGVGAPAAAVTIPLGAGIGYVVGGLGFGALGDYAAQKIEGEEDANLIRMGTSSLLNLVPGTEIKSGPRVLREASKALAKRPIATTAAVGAIARPLGMAGEEVFTDADYSLADYGKAAASGAALGGGLGYGSKQIGRIFGKYRNKTPEEISNLVNQGDKSAVETVNILTAGLTPDEITANNERAYRSISDYLKGTMGRIAPSRVLGPEATRLAKYSKSGIEASESQALALGKRIDSYLAKNPVPEVAQEAVDLLTGNKLKTNLLPENIKKDIIEGRELIREQQQAMLDLYNSGKLVIPETKAEMLEASLNRGDYVTKFYRFFNEAGYQPSKEDGESLKRRLMTGLTDEQKQARMDDFISGYRPPSNEVERLRRAYGITPGGEGKSNAAYQRDLKSISTPSKERIAKFQKELDEEKMTEAEANEYIATLQTKMKDQPEGVSSFVTAGGDPKFLKSRKVLSPELEKYLGRVDPIGERITGTVSFLSKDNELRKADAEISQALFDMGVLVKASDANPGSGFRPIELRRGKAAIGEEPLFGTAETQAALNKIYGAKLDQASQSWAKRAAIDIANAYLALKKGSLVLGNVASYMVQIPGNIVITAGAGMNPILGLGGAAKLALGGLRGTKLGNLPLLRNVADQASPELLREYRNLQKRGMMSNAVPFADVQANLSGKRISRAVAKLLDTPGKVYSLADNTFRLVNYMNWKLELKRVMPTAPKELIEEGAARLTTRTYPNYDSLNEGLKTASRFGLGIGPFASYGLELARTQYQQARVIKELADGTFASKLGKEFEGIPINTNAAKKLGAKRLAAMATAYVGANMAFNEANRKSVSEDEEKALRKTVLPDYAENKSLFIKRNDDGSFSYSNVSYYAPQTMIAAPFNAGMRGESEEQALGNFAKTIVEDYGGAGTFSQEAGFKLFYGRDPKTGDVISSAPTAIGQIEDRLVDIAKGLRPATVVALEKQQPTSEKLARLAGIRIERQEIPKGFGFRAREIKEKIDNVRENISSSSYKLKDQRITPQEYEKTIQEENQNYAAFIQKMQRHANNLKVLGEDDGTIIPMLRDAGFSSTQALDILDGKFTPIDPNGRVKLSDQFAKVRGKTETETMQNILAVQKSDPVLANRLAGMLREEKKAAILNLTPKEKLIASLPTDDKVERLLPEIMANENPDAYITRLAQKRIISAQDAQAIQIRRNLK